MKKSFLLIPLVLWVATGCYSYQAIPPADAVEGTQVRARLTIPRSEQVHEQLGSQNGTVFEGTFLEEAGTGEYVFELPVSGAQQRIYQRVSVPMAEILEIEERQFSTVKTAGLVGVLATGTIIAVLDVFNLTGNDSREDDDDVDQTLIPLFSWSW